jgi:hypothetical protein
MSTTGLEPPTTSGPRRDDGRFTPARIVGSFGTILILASLVTPWLEHWLDTSAPGQKPFDLPANFWAQEGRTLGVCDGCSGASSLKAGAVLLALAGVCALGLILPRGGRVVRLIGGAGVLVYTLLFIYEVRNRFILDYVGQRPGLLHFLGVGVLLAILGGFSALASAFVPNRRPATSPDAAVASDDPTAVT